MIIETKQFKKGTKEPEEFEIKKEKGSRPPKRKKEAVYYFDENDYLVEKQGDDKSGK